MIKRTVLISTLSMFLSINTAPAAAVHISEVGANSLVITEYLANPVGIGDSKAEYFEIFNATGSAIDLNKLIVRDDGRNEFKVSELCIAAGAFAVFSSSTGTPLGLMPDYIYGSGMSLANADDEIGLYRPDGTLINKVSYTDGDFFGGGIAHELARFNPETPELLFGPSAGTDFIASVSTLPLGNFGSPGFAGGTSIRLPDVPVPPAVWMFGSALSILGWLKRKPAGIKGEADEQLVGSSSIFRPGVHSPDQPWSRFGPCRRDAHHLPARAWQGGGYGVSS